MRHTTHTTRITGTWVDTKRRRHQRLFRDYSAHRFRRVFRATIVEHIAAHRAQHPPTIVDTPQPTPSPSHPPHRPPHHTHNTRHTTHTPHTSQVLGWTPSDEGTDDHSATILPYVSPCISVAKRSHITTHRAQHRHTIVNTIPPPTHTTHAT